MSDVDVFHFWALDVLAGVNRRSPRPGTLTAIEGIGDPILESRYVVDSSELDAHGFLRASSVLEGKTRKDELGARIASLELRAQLRETEAALLDERRDGARRSSLESDAYQFREQAERLNSEYLDLLEKEL